MSHHDRYLDQKEELLTGIEEEISAAIDPILQTALDRLAELPEDADDQRSEALTPLNDELERVIGETLFLRQLEISELAIAFYPGTIAPMQTPVSFMNEIKMSGVPLSKWFERKSPSRWMQDILRASPAEVRHTVRTAIDHAVWSSAAMTEKFSWESTPLLMWINRPELSATGTCDVCSPMDGVKVKKRSDFGIPYPAHPFCKCGIVPVRA